MAPPTDGMAPGESSPEATERPPPASEPPPPPPAADDVAAAAAGAPPPLQARVYQLELLELAKTRNVSGRRAGA